MSASNLIVVPQQQRESPAERISRLQAETRALAREHVESLSAALGQVCRLAGEISDGGEAYPVGAREVARRLVEQTSSQASTLAAILQRD